MARIAGVNIPLNKRAEIGLTYIYGIGQSTAQDLLAKVGIDPDTLPRIFDAFFTTKARQGPGLGLSISNSLVSQAGGTITATSSPGVGSVFTVQLPADTSTGPT